MKSFKPKTYIFLLLIIIVLLAIYMLRPSITFLVVGEEGTPIESAEVTAGYSFGGGWSGLKARSIVKKGVTDSEGYFVYKDSAADSSPIFVRVEKDGYYRTYLGSQIRGRSKTNKENPRKLLLRKIKNPLPMYARNTRGSSLEMPAIGDDIGFDLFVGDWVEPYGNGKVADIIFNLDRSYTNRKENHAVLSIKFSNKYDGIRGFNDTYHRESDFKTAYLAPIDGYKGDYLKHVSRLNGKFKTNVNKELNHVFRIRSEEKDGKFYRGMYGRINGDIIFDVMSSKTAQVSFRYFLNPDYSRNLEFDPKRNLSKGLNSLEEIWLN